MIKQWFWMPFIILFSNNFQTPSVEAALWALSQASAHCLQKLPYNNKAGNSRESSKEKINVHLQVQAYHTHTHTLSAKYSSSGSKDCINWFDEIIKALLLEASFTDLPTMFANSSLDDNDASSQSRIFISVFYNGCLKRISCHWLTMVNSIRTTKEDTMSLKLFLQYLARANVVPLKTGFPQYMACGEVVFPAKNWIFPWKISIPIMENT